MTTSLPPSTSSSPQAWSTADPTPFGLGVALLEAAELVERLRGEARRLLGDVDPAATRRRGARMVLVTEPEEAERVPPDQRERVARLLDGAADELPEAEASALRDLAGFLAHGGGSSMLAAMEMAPPPAAAGAAPAPAALRLVPPLEPEPAGRPTDCAFLDDPNVGVDEIGALRTEGHLDAWAVGTFLRDPWLRVMRVRGDEPPVPLAVAPFLGGGERREASVLVSDAEIDTELVVEVTAAPADTPLPGRLRAVRRACTLGRAAVRAERVGSAPHAVRLWRDCADAWRELGDDGRADAAEVRARRAGRSPTRW